MVQTEGKVSYTMSVKEDPLISYNDMAYISERNSIVFRAGDPPIWNRNQTVLPMSYKLFENTISQPGKKYSLKSLPTMSTALERISWSAISSACSPLSGCDIYRLPMSTPSFSA